MPEQKIELAGLGDNLIFSDEIPQLSSARDLLVLNSLIKETGAQFLIVDPAYLAIRGDDISNVFKQGEQLRRCSMEFQETGVTFVLIHRARKTIEHYRPIGLAEIAGAGFGEFARQRLMINPRCEFGERSNGVHSLWLSYGGSAGHSGTKCIDVDEGIYRPNSNDWRKWDVRVTSERDAKHQAKEAKNVRDNARQRKEVDAVKTTIRAGMKTLPERKGTRNNIVDCYGGSKSRVFVTAFSELCRDGELQSCKLKKSNGQEYDGYHLIEKL